jgi:hypothetical protein
MAQDGRMDFASTSLEQLAHVIAQKIDRPVESEPWRPTAPPAWPRYSPS